MLTHGPIAVVEAKAVGSDRMRVAESYGDRGLSVSVVRGVRDGLFSMHMTGGGDSTVRNYAMP